MLYNISDLKLEVENFEKLTNNYLKKGKNKKTLNELNIIEERLYSKFDILRIQELANNNEILRTKNIGNILKLENRLIKNSFKISNSISNFKNYLASKFKLFFLRRKLISYKTNWFFALIITLFFLLPLLIFWIILILLKFIFRKKDKNKKKKKYRGAFSNYPDNDMDDKLFDIIDKYAKNKEDIKLIMDLIKKKVSPLELEETLKKLVENPLFKDLIKDLEFPEFAKELKNLLEKKLDEIESELIKPIKLDKDIKEFLGKKIDNLLLVKTVKNLFRIKQNPNKIKKINNVELDKLFKTSVNRIKNNAKTKVNRLKNAMNIAFIEKFVIPLNGKTKKFKKNKIKFNSIVEDILENNRNVFVKNKKFKIKVKNNYKNKNYVKGFKNKDNFVKLKNTKGLKNKDKLYKIKKDINKIKKYNKDITYKKSVVKNKIKYKVRNDFDKFSSKFDKNKNYSISSKKGIKSLEENEEFISYSR